MGEIKKHNSKKQNNFTLRKITGTEKQKCFESILIVSQNPVSFLGDVDAKSGLIVAEDSDIKGECISGKVFAFPYGRGSTVGTYVLLQMKKLGTAPLMIINKKTESILVAGAVIADIPLADNPNPDLFEYFKNIKRIKVKINELDDKFILKIME